MSRPTKLDPCYVNRRVVLPYGLKVKEIEQAVAETYRLFHGLNDYLKSSGFRPLPAARRRHRSPSRHPSPAVSTFSRTGLAVPLLPVPACSRS